MWLHRLTRLVVGAGFLMIIVGGMVASTDSGLSVPDWPSSYGWTVFTFPYSRWAGGIFFQQGHRILGVLVGTLTAILVVALWRAEERTWVRRIGSLALVAVIMQGLLGGVAVRSALAPLVSTTHAGFAQIFLALAVSLAIFTSPGWKRGYPASRPDAADALGRGKRTNAQQPMVADDRPLLHLTAASIILVYFQILLGAVVRHAAAAQAIPDYPLAFGRLVPPADALAVGPVLVNFVHRIGALAVVVVLAATIWRVLSRHSNHPELVRPALLVALLLVVEIVLGALALSPAGLPIVRTSLVAVGGLIMATTVVLALRVRRPLFGSGLARASV